MTAVRLAAVVGLQGAIAVAMGYLCLIELAPPPLRHGKPLFHGWNWNVQQALLLGLISCLLVILSATNRRGVCGLIGGVGLREAAVPLLAALNVLPLAVQIVTSLILDAQAHTCEPTPNCTNDADETPLRTSMLDYVGVLSARICKVDLGISFLLVARGAAAWLTAATGGSLGYTEAMPLHRLAGWWCISQAALHSVCYLLFYLDVGGFSGLWRDVFPWPLPDSGGFNRLGLINFYGLLAFILLPLLLVPAHPRFRRRFYHIFQRLHLPTALLFVLFGALHAITLLLFAVPGLAAWYCARSALDTNDSIWSSRRRLPAAVRLLRGTSGPWVEMTIDCGKHAQLSAAPRGMWILLRALPLGKEKIPFWKERHPLSVTQSASGNPSELCVVVSAQGGNWSQALAATSQVSTSTIQVEIAGPFAFGGGQWSLHGDCDGTRPEGGLLLLAGGTGVTGWLPALAKSDERQVHLVWCVQTMTDYLALADRLPLKSNVEVTVYVTRANAAAAAEALEAPPTGMQHANGEPAETTGATLVPLLAPGGALLALASLAATLAGLGVGFWGWRSLKADIRLALKDGGWLGESVLGYSISYRCLPIVLISVVMLLTTAAARCLLLQRHGTSKSLGPLSRCLLSCRCASSPISLERGPGRLAVQGRSGSPRQIPIVKLFSGMGSTEQTGQISTPAPQQVSASEPQQVSASEPQQVSASEPQQASTLRQQLRPLVADAMEAPQLASDGAHDIRTGRPNLVELIRAESTGHEKEGGLVVAACGPGALVRAAQKAVVAVRNDLRKNRPMVRIEFSGGEAWW